MQEFLHDAKVRPGQWIGCDLSRVPRMPMSHCAREAWVTEIQSAADPSRVPPPIPVMSFDIETGFVSTGAARRTQYPQITDPNSAVTYIGVTQRDGAAPDRRVVLALAPAHDLAGDEACPVRSFRSEAELLSGFAALVAEWDPAWIGGYNVWGFDWQWLGMRHDMYELFRHLRPDTVEARWRAARLRTRSVGILNGLLPRRRRDDEDTATVAVPRDVEGIGPGPQTVRAVRSALRRLQEAGGGTRPGNGQLMGWQDDILQRYRTAADAAAAYRHFGTSPERRVPLPVATAERGLPHVGAEDRELAHGQSFQYRIDMPGRVAFDLYKYVKESPMKLRSYKLKDVGEALGVAQNKIDLEYETMFQYHASGDPAKALEVCRYCLRDTTVPLDVMAKMNMVLGTMSLAAITWLPAQVLCAAAGSSAASRCCSTSPGTRGWCSTRGPTSRASAATWGRRCRSRSGGTRATRSGTSTLLPCTRRSCRATTSTSTRGSRRATGPEPARSPRRRTSASSRYRAATGTSTCSSRATPAAPTRACSPAGLPVRPVRRRQP